MCRVVCKGARGAREKRRGGVWRCSRSVEEQTAVSRSSRCVQVVSGRLPAHERLLDLSQGRVFGEPLPLGGILCAKGTVDVGISDGEEFLRRVRSTAKRCLEMNLPCGVCCQLLEVRPSGLHWAFVLARCCSSNSSSAALRALEDTTSGIGSGVLRHP